MQDDQSKKKDGANDARPEIVIEQQTSPYESKYSDDDSLKVKSKESIEPHPYTHHAYNKSYEGKYCEFLTSMEQRANNVG